MRPLTWKQGIRLSHRVGRGHADFSHSGFAGGHAGSSRTRFIVLLCCRSLSTSGGACCIWLMSIAHKGGRPWPGQPLREAFKSQHGRPKQAVELPGVLQRAFSTASRNICGLLWTVQRVTDPSLRGSVQAAGSGWSPPGSWGLEVGHLKHSPAI